mmetsp:Transcript_92189/g.192763  ORF Transcript_92189/g.192763 Transcript_92189/m.192763 type:complete len:224 (+) Transcript_92189:137-808(+)|eukprot:CAMPEP_0206480284 /NCGR_PEP_ID=MMETSP0324_2-20121206/37177_1 /ASSEMBLY_ACC=CAM_ASM_000836 /TAXON_ID=2866 /ORGANISM="Crypthecodinium cohnii, Strain Seligo" /LENGTH=223 /DNA_ID=CAMNT_0053956991 /DNA_START=136 /DNA_END=807 /DNA_ORIENTATION=+
MALKTAGIKSVNWPRDSRTNLHQADAKADLRGVHWQIGYRPGEATQTESKHKYVNHRGSPAVLNEAKAAELRRSHIDLAVGADKSSKQWETVMTGDMCRNASEKFGCKKPEGFQALGAELRKSSVSISDQTTPPPHSELKDRFGPPPKFEQAKSYADSLGKELRSSRIDIANGQEKIARNWESSMRAEMGRHAKEKFLYQQPAGFQHLIAELRKSSVPLPGAH